MSRIGKKWIGVSLLAAAFLCVAPFQAKAGQEDIPDGVMGQSIEDEVSVSPQEDYNSLVESKDGMKTEYAQYVPILRAATSYSDAFKKASFSKTSALNGKTYYHDSKFKSSNLINGIDVSWHQGGGKGSHQTNLNWKTIHNAGVDFTYVRAASRDSKDGSIYEDTCADAHIKGAKANQINVGLYVFSQALTEKEAADEADYVLKLIRKYGWDIDMPIVIDREPGSYKRLTAGKLSKAKETAVIQAFADKITTAGYSACVYASYSWFKDYINTKSLKNCRTWIARYNNMTTSNYAQGTPYADTPYNYEFWQYAQNLKLSGYSGYLDANYWYKNTSVAVSGLTASASTADSVTLNWKSVTDAKQYEIYRYNEKTKQYTNIGTTNKTSYTDKNLQSAKEYQYKVRCTWTIGGKKYAGTYSAVAKIATLPAQVKNLTATSVSTSEITLNWDAVSGADGYRVYEYDAGKQSYEPIKTIGGKQTQLTRSGLKSSQGLRYRVRAYKKLGEKVYWGAWSAVCSVGTMPETTTGLKSVNVGENTIELQWDAVSDATGYAVYRYNEDQKKYERIATLQDQTVVEFTDTGLTSASGYNYKVRAYLRYGGKTYFGTPSAALKVCTRPDRIGIKSLTASASAVTVEWEECPGATGYQVLRYNAQTGKYQSIVTTRNLKQLNYTDNNLKTGQTYYYKVRAFCTYGGTTMFGSASAAVKIRIQ